MTASGFERYINRELLTIRHEVSSSFILHNKEEKSCGANKAPQDVVMELGSFKLLNFFIGFYKTVFNCFLKNEVCESKESNN